FARYGMRDQALRLFGALFDATQFFDLRRLPELFCGFERRSGEGPTLYPVACAPQAWASGSVFMLLQAALGLSIDAQRKEIAFTHPVLPEAIPELRLTGLRAGDSWADVLLENHPHDLSLTVLRRQGDVRVVVMEW